MFNAWDAGSARAVQDAGAAAIATSSASVAAAHGFRDGEDLPFELVLANLRRIVTHVDLPVTIDLEGGYGRSPAVVREHVADTKDLLTPVQQGRTVVATVKEKQAQTGHKRHPYEQPLGRYSVLFIDGMDQDPHQPSLRVNGDLSFAAFTSFVGVQSARPLFFSRLHELAVDNQDTRISFSVFFEPDLHAQRVVDPFERAAVDRTPAPATYVVRTRFFPYAAH